MTDFETALTDEQISDLLFVSEEPAAAELAMVFAAACEEQMQQRTLRGVELWRQGYAPRVLVTGGGVLASRDPEAKRMVQIAREAGMPEECLLAEDQSSNTMENAKLSLDLLERAGLLDSLKIVLLVSSQWHMARVLGTVRKFFPSTIHFLCCPSLEGCNRDNWTKSDECRQLVMDEAVLYTTFKSVGAI